MMNRTILVGRMVKDPEIRYSNSGTAVCSFTIAVNRFGKKDEADFISIVCFKKTAENTANFCKKGSLVGIDGKLQTRSYQNNEGRTIYVTEVVADTIAFLERVSRPEGETSGNQQTGFRTENKNPSDDPFAGEGETIDISNDDLPF